MAAPGAGMMDGAGNGKHFASLFRRQPRGDQRTAGDTGLDHQHAEGQTADDPIASGEVASTGASIQRKL
ncbi:hypothetical protein D3C86_1918500 [compost metagenome]